MNLDYDQTNANSQISRILLTTICGWDLFQKFVPSSAETHQTS